MLGSLATLPGADGLSDVSGSTKKGCGVAPASCEAAGPATVPPASRPSQRASRGAGFLATRPGAIQVMGQTSWAGRHAAVSTVQVADSIKGEASKRAITASSVPASAVVGSSVAASSTSSSPSVRVCTSRTG